MTYFCWCHIKDFPYFLVVIVLVLLSIGMLLIIINVNLKEYGFKKALNVGFGIEVFSFVLCFLSRKIKNGRFPNHPVTTTNKWHDWILPVTLLGVLIIMMYISCLLLIVRKRGKSVYGYLNFVFQQKAVLCSRLY